MSASRSTACGARVLYPLGYMVRFSGTLIFLRKKSGYSPENEDDALKHTQYIQKLSVVGPFSRTVFTSSVDTSTREHGVRKYTRIAMMGRFHGSSVRPVNCVPRFRVKNSPEVDTTEGGLRFPTTPIHGMSTTHWP